MRSQIATTYLSTGCYKPWYLWWMLKSALSEFLYLCRMLQSFISMMDAVILYIKMISLCRMQDAVICYLCDRCCNLGSQNAISLQDAVISELEKQIHQLERQAEIANLRLRINSNFSFLINVLGCTILYIRESEANLNYCLLRNIFMYLFKLQL